MALDISSEEREGKQILHIEGRLDATSSPILDEKLAELITNGYKAIIVDFAKVDYLSSAGIRLMLSNTKKATMQQGKLIFCSINEEVMEIIRMAGFEKILNIVSTQDEALQSC